jgi:hypothetical protein
MISPRGRAVIANVLLVMSVPAWLGVIFLMRGGTPRTIAVVVTAALTLLALRIDRESDGAHDSPR